MKYSEQQIEEMLIRFNPESKIRESLKTRITGKKFPVKKIFAGAVAAACAVVLAVALHVGRGAPEVPAGEEFFISKNMLDDGRGFPVIDRAAYRDVFTLPTDLYDDGHGFPSVPPEYAYVMKEKEKV